MGDSIDRQAAIDALADMHCKSDEDGYVWIIRSDAWARIDALPAAQQEQRWIPCSERLPEYDGEMYLVTDYCEQINRRRIHVSYCYVNREGFWSDVPLGYKVLAWMPLPEPYREDIE